VGAWMLTIVAVSGLTPFRAFKLWNRNVRFRPLRTSKGEQLRLRAG